MADNLSSQYISASFQKLVQISGSQIADGTGSLIDNLTLTASYATTANSALTATSATTATSASYATTASFALNAAGGAADTGSLLTTASISDATITFTKGDASTFNIVVNNVVNADSASVATTADSATSASYATTAASATSSSYATTATSASYATNASTADSATSSSYATTASYALNADVNPFPYTGNASITGDLSVTGSILRLSGSYSGSAIDNITDIYTSTAKINHVISLTQAEYNAISASADPNTLYYITDAVSSVVSASYAVTASYALSAVETDTLQTVTDRGATTTNAITASALYLNSAGDTSYIAGNLDVAGTITYISSSTLQIGDNVIEINFNKAAGNSGILTYDTTSPFTASILWDATNNYWIGGGYTTEEKFIMASDTGSMSVATASYATTAVSASHADNASAALIATTASYATTAVSASYALTAASATTATTASYVAAANVDGTVASATSASYATTASYAFTAVTSSYVAAANVDGTVALATSASFATTASHASNVRDGIILNDAVVSGSFNGDVKPLTIASNTASMDCSTGNFFTLTLATSADTHLDASNIAPGQTINIKVTQPATTGSLSFSDDFAFPSGSTYVGSAVANAVDIISMVSFDGSTLYANQIENLV